MIRFFDFTILFICCDLCACRAAVYFRVVYLTIFQARILRFVGSFRALMNAITRTVLGC